MCNYYLALLQETHLKLSKGKAQTDLAFYLFSGLWHEQKLLEMPLNSYIFFNFSKTIFFGTKKNIFSKIYA